MAYTPISSLPVYVGSSLPSGSYFEVSTPDGLSSTGFSSYRATPEQIVGTNLSGYVPTSRIIGTNSLSGLNGGGDLTTNRYLSLDVANLSEKTTPTVADAIAMNTAVDNTPVKVLPANFYKTISGLTHKSVPLSTDRMVIYSVADSDSRYSTLGEAFGAAGAVPPGGTTGQPLIKLSGADFNTGFATLPVIGGGTGQITLTNHSVLVGAGTAAINQIPVPANGTIFQGNSGADPSWTSTPTLGVAGTTAGTLAFSGLTSGTTTLQSAAVASGTLTLPAATDTIVARNTTDTLTNKIVNAVASTLSSASLNVPQGVAPTSPVNGDIWTTSGGVYAQIAGATVPLGGTAALANPTSSIGLTAVNGTALTAMRSDAAPALSQSITPTWTGLHTFNAGFNIAIGQSVQFGTVTLSDVNNNALVVGDNETIQFGGTNGGLRWYSDGVALYTEQTQIQNDTLTLQNSKSNSVTAFQVQANGSPSGDPTAWATLALTFQPGPNEERINYSALYSGAERKYGVYQVVTGSGAYRPVVFYGNGSTEAYRINAASDSTNYFNTPVAIGTNTILGTGNAWLSIAKDANIAANNNTAQLQIAGNTNLDERILIGRDTTNHRGFIQAATIGVSYDPLYINQAGGPVTIGPGGLSISGGNVSLSGSGSGTVTIQPQAAAGTYNFNLPTSAGTSGQPLLSGGGGATAMTFGTLGVTGGGTGLSSTAAGTILASASANTITATATPTLGANGGTGGQITLNGSTSGSVALRVAAAAGTGTVFQLPATNGSNTNVLTTDGSGNTSWAAAGAGTVTSIGPDSGSGSLYSLISGSYSTSTAVTSTGTLGLAVPVTPQGRISLQTGTPVMVTTTSGATTVYYTPYIGQFVPIYNGTVFVLTNIGGELSQATTDTTKSPAACTTNSNYDIFVWNDSGTIRATRGPLWSSSSARGTGAGTTELTRVSGVLVNAQAITNGPAANRGTYVGTIRTNGSSQVDFIFGASASGGTAGSLGVWNMYNRADLSTTVTDSGTSYTYTSSTVRQARASAGNQVSFIVGQAGDCIYAEMAGEVVTAAAANATALFGLGYDTTSAFSSKRMAAFATTAATYLNTSTAAYTTVPAIGWHTVSANEASDGTNANTFDNGAGNQLYFTFRM